MNRTFEFLIIIFVSVLLIGCSQSKVITVATTDLLYRVNILLVDLPVSVVSVSGEVKLQVQSEGYLPVTSDSEIEDGDLLIVNQNSHVKLVTVVGNELVVNEGSYMVKPK